jgi:hypothetical protein
VDRLRYLWAVVALAAGVAVSLLAGGPALADTVCGTTGTVGYCAQFGVNGFAYRLAVEDTGAQNIAGFAFTLPSGTTATGAAGNTSCSASGSVVTCTGTIAPGGSTFVDILTGSPVTVGSSGTLVLKDAAGDAQPGVPVPLQSSSICAEGTSTTTCNFPTTASSTTTTPTTTTAGGTPAGGTGSTTTATSVSTTTTTATTPSCEAKLDVTKELHGLTILQSRGKPHDFLAYSLHPGSTKYSAYFVIAAVNESGCVAKDVVLEDLLPAEFKCTEGDHSDPAGGLGVVHFPCRGGGRFLRFHLGDLPPHYRAYVIAEGYFEAPGHRVAYETSNTARGEAENASLQESATIHVKVVSRAEWLKLEHAGHYWSPI